MLHFVQRMANWTGLSTTRCPVCSVLTNHTHDTLCLDCAEALYPRTGGYCLQCGEIFGDDDTPPTLCGECHHTPQPWDRLAFHGIYTGRLRDLILGYKFNKDVGSARLLADMAYKTLRRHTLQTPDVIIPVPLHTRRLWWRGFNQSTELCRSLSRELQRPILDRGLTRIRHTRPQTRLGMVERRENIKQAFAADSALVKGKSVLLIDDVYTTGATLRECAQMLNRAGVASLDVLVLARALH